MAEKVLLVPVSEIGINRAHNYSRPDGIFFDGDADQAQVVRMMLNDWQAQHGVAIVTPATDPKTFVEFRKTLKKTLAAAKDTFEVKDAGVDGAKYLISPSDELREFTDLYGNGAKIKYDLVGGYRRTTSIPKINAILRKMGQDPITHIPVVVRSYENELQRQLDCLAENNLKTEGLLRPTVTQNLRSAQRLVSGGCREADIRKAFNTKRGTTQKLFATCALDAAFPEMEIVDRLIKGEIDYTPLRAKEMRDAVKDKSVEKAKAALAPNRTNASKAMARPEIEALRDHNKNSFVKVICDAILANRREDLMQLSDAWKTCNDFYAETFGGDMRK